MDSMRVYELRDAGEARRFLLQGLWLQRAMPPRAATVAPALSWLLELAAHGEPLPPVAFVADVGHVALGLDREKAVRPDLPTVPGWPAGLARRYEDQVLGKLYADATFARAADALARYQGRDRARGLAFLVEQLRRRAGLGGVHLNPAAIKSARDLRPEQALAEGWESLDRDGPMPLLIPLYESLIRAVRDVADVIGPEDVFELEHGTALAAFGQRVALRQVLRAAAEFEADLGRLRRRPPARRYEVPTRLLDEDAYPVGGFSSISTRGSIESLLHSQLAYMEPADRPDLFDIKFLRDELLYYSRDENQFLRRRRTLAFALFPDLALARHKDAELPRQRIVLLLALLVAAVRTLTDWLSAEALLFEFLFLHHQDDEASPLTPEQELIEMLLREQVANGTVTTTRLSSRRLPEHVSARARRSLCHSLLISTTDPPLTIDSPFVSRLVLDGPRPRLGLGAEPLQVPEPDDAPASWQATLGELLALWV